MRYQLNSFKFSLRRLGVNVTRMHVLFCYLSLHLFGEAGEVSYLGNILGLLDLLAGVVHLIHMAYGPSVSDPAFYLKANPDPSFLGMKSVLQNRNYVSRFRFRYRLLTSYGSGSVSGP
jgi:hypothetical protein